MAWERRSKPSKCPSMINRETRASRRLSCDLSFVCVRFCLYFKILYVQKYLSFAIPARSCSVDAKHIFRMVYNSLCHNKLQINILIVHILIRTVGFQLMKFVPEKRLVWQNPIMCVIVCRKHCSDFLLLFYVSATVNNWKFYFSCKNEVSCVSNN